MRSYTKLLVTIAISLLICLPSFLSLRYYTKPMEDVSYDLSLIPEDGEEWAGNKGWNIYTDMEGDVTELTADKSGGYTGTLTPGQTFYYSRRLTESLDNPTLQIEAANRTITVFLDDTPIYTDCPKLDNRIGYLALPMLDYDRYDPVKISLPPDYSGKTLTIAQSTPEVAEVLDSQNTVWPCEVTLYCGYSYESTIIADTSDTMIPAALEFALILIILTAFIWNASHGTISMILPVLAMTTMFQMCSTLAQASFFQKYYGLHNIDPSWLFFHLSIGSLLLVYTLCTKKLRPLYIAITSVYWCSVLLCYLAQLNLLVPYGDTYLFFTRLPQSTGLVSLFLVLLLSFVQWRLGSRFQNMLCKVSLAIIAGYFLVLMLSIPAHSDYAGNVFSSLKGDIANLLPNFSLKMLWILCLLSCAAAILIELIDREWSRRTEYAIVDEKYRLALNSYENLQKQTEEIMILKHDTSKHYTLLRTLVEESPEKAADYLDELVGQIDLPQAVISCENEMVDIIVNGNIHRAASKGIRVQTVRTQAPAKLSVRDTDLCCLLMNILENAITAASSSLPDGSNESNGADEPYISLDFYCKGQHFVFSCTNTMSESPSTNRTNKKSIPEHGYGLKIINKIMHKYDDMVAIEQTGNTYQITIILPL